MRSITSAPWAICVFFLISAGCSSMEQEFDPTVDVADQVDDYDGDLDDNGIMDGVDDPIVAGGVDSGRTMFVHESIIGWSDRVCVYGSGFGGDEDWITCLRVADDVSINGDGYSAFTFDDYGDVYRVNFGREGADGPDDYTNWANLDGVASFDEFVWTNPDGTRSLCFRVAGDLLMAHGGTDCNATY